MENLDKAWHTAADTLKSEFNTLQSAERQWIDQNASEPMAGVQGKGTITDPYDGGNRDVQPGAPRGHQNTGRSTDLTSASIDNSLASKTTMEESYSSHKSGGGGGGRGQFQSYTRGTPEQRSSHHTSSNYSSSGMGGTTQGSGLSSKGRSAGDYSTQSSGIAQGLGGIHRSGINQGDASTSSAGGSGISSSMRDTTSIQGSGLQSSQLPSDLDQGYNVSGINEPTPSRVASKNQQGGFQGTTSSSTMGSSGVDRSHHFSNMPTTTRDFGESQAYSKQTGLGTSTTSSSKKSGGLEKSYMSSGGSNITDSSRGTGLQGATIGSTRDTAQQHYGDSSLEDPTTKYRGVGSGQREGIGGSDITDSTRGAGFQGTSGTTRSSRTQGASMGSVRDAAQQHYGDSSIGDATTKYRGVDKSQHKSTSGSGITDYTRGSGLQDTSGVTQSGGIQGATMGSARGAAQQQIDDSSLGDATTRYRGVDKSQHKSTGGSGLTDFTRGSGLQDTGETNRSSGMQGASMKSARDTAQHSSLGGATTKYRGVDSSQHKGTGVTGSSMEPSTMSNTAKSYQRDTGLGEATRSSGFDTSPGSGMTGTTRDIGMSQGHGTSGLKDSTATSSGLDSGYNRSNISSNMPSTTRESGISQGYDNSAMQDTASKATRDMDSGYQGSRMADTSGSGIPQGTSNTRNMGQKSTSTQSSGLGSGAGATNATRGSGLANMTKSDLDSHIAVGDIAKKAGLVGAAGAAGAAGIAGASSLGQGSQQSRGMAPSTGVGSKTQSSGMDSTRGSGMQQGYQESSMDPTTSTGNKTQGSGIGGTTASRSTGLDSGYQDTRSGMTESARQEMNLGSQGYRDADVGELGQKSSLGDTSASRPAGYQGVGAGAGMAGTTRGSDMGRTQQTSSMGQTSGTRNMAQSSGPQDLASTRSIDSGYEGTGMAGNTHEAGLSQQGYQTSGVGGTGQQSSRGPTGAGADSGYQNTEMTDALRDNDLAEKHAGSRFDETAGFGSNQSYQDPLRDNDLAQKHAGSRFDETAGYGSNQAYKDGSGFDETAGYGNNQASQDANKAANTKDATSEAQPRRKPSLIERAKKKIGLGDSSDKSSQDKSLGDTAKSGLDQGYEKSGLSDKPGVDQAYQKFGAGDKLKSGVDERFGGSGSKGAAAEGADASREVPPSDFGKVHQSTAGQGYSGSSMQDTSRGAGVADTTRSGMNQGYSGSGMQDPSRGAGIEDTTRSGMNQGYSGSSMQDTSRGAGIEDTTRSGMNQAYQSAGGATDTSMPSGGQRYQDTGMRGTSEGTGLQDMSRSGAGFQSSGMRDTTSTGPSGPGYETSSPGISQPTRSDMGQSYGSSGLRDTTQASGPQDTSRSSAGLQDISRSGAGYQGSGIQDTTANAPSGPGYQTSGTGLSHSTQSGMGQSYGSSRMADVSDEGVGVGETTKLPTNQQYQSGSGAAGGGFNDTMASSVPEEEIEEDDEDPGAREIRVPSTILTPRTKRSSTAKRKSGIEDEGTALPMSPNYGTSGIDKSIDSTMDQGYSQPGLGQGYQQPGVDAASGNRMGEGYQPSGLGRASESAMDQGYSKSGIDQDAIGSTTAAGTAPRTAAVSGTEGQSGLGGTTMGQQGYQRSTGMGDSTTTDPGMTQLNQDYQRSGIRETIRSGTGQAYQRSGLGRTHPSGTGTSQGHGQGLGQGIQRSTAGAGATGSGSTGQGSQMLPTTTKQAPPDYSGQTATTGGSGIGGGSIGGGGGGYQTSSNTEQRNQGLSTGIGGGSAAAGGGASAGSSKPMTMTTSGAHGGKVSQEALKGPQCPARDPYDFEKAIDNPRRKSYASRSRSNANATSGSAQQAAAAAVGKAEKEHLGPLGQMKVKFEKVIHPNRS